MASPQSLLDVLKAPQASDLTRKRKIGSNPPVGQKRSRGQGSSEPKSVSAKDRVNEFPDECLTVTRGGKLFLLCLSERAKLEKEHHHQSYRLQEAQDKQGEGPDK